MKGRWSAPGGGPKQFRCPIEDVSLRWYHEKQQTLIFQGKNGELLKTILVRKVGEVASTTNESQPENVNAKPIMDQVLSTDRSKVFMNKEVTGDPTGTVFDRANRSCRCDTVLSECEDMKLNI